MATNTWWNALIQRTGTAVPQQFTVGTTSTASANNPILHTWQTPQQQQQYTAPQNNPMFKAVFPAVSTTPYIKYPTAGTNGFGTLGGLKGKYGVSTAATAATTFNGDDYQALFAIAMKRPDIFEGIGRDTGWNVVGSSGNNIEAGTNWGANDVGSKAWYWTTPAMRMRVVEEWIRQGMKTGEAIIKDNNGDPQAIARALGASDPSTWSEGWKRAVNEAKAIDWLAQKWSGGFDPSNGWLRQMRANLDPYFSNDEAKRSGRIYMTAFNPATVENIRIATIATLGGRDPLAVAQQEGWNGADLADFAAGGKYGSLYRDIDKGYSDSYSGAYTLLPWISSSITDNTNTWLLDKHAGWRQYDPTRTALYRLAVSTAASGAAPIVATTGTSAPPWNPYTGTGTRTTPKQYSFDTQIAGRDGRPGLLTGRLDEELWRYLNTNETKTADEDVTALRDIISDAAAKGDRPEYTKQGAMWGVEGRNGKYTIYFYGPNQFVIWRIK